MALFTSAATSISTLFGSNLEPSRPRKETGPQSKSKGHAIRTTNNHVPVRFSNECHNTIISMRLAVKGAAFLKDEEAARRNRLSKTFHCPVSRSRRWQGSRVFGLHVQRSSTELNKFL